MKSHIMSGLNLAIIPLLAFLLGAYLSMLLWQSVSIFLPLMMLLLGLFVVESILLRLNTLPQMPNAVAFYWGVAGLWAVLIVVLGFYTQVLESEALVLGPLLCLGFAVMYWVLLVCCRELILLIFSPATTLNSQLDTKDADRDRIHFRDWKY